MRIVGGIFATSTIDALVELVVLVYSAEHDHFRFLYV